MTTVDIFANVRRKPQRMWPIQPFMDALGVDSNKRMGWELGVSAASVSRWRTTGITDKQADHFTLRLGIAPSQVWPDWYTAVEQASA